MLKSPLMNKRDETTSPPSDAPFLLPKHLRFARSLALVSGAVVGIAAGAAVLGFGSGCSGLQSCNGICGVYGVQPPVDAHGQYDRPVDHVEAPDGGERPDGPADAANKPTDGHAGGGPGPSPHLPADWLA